VSGIWWGLLCLVQDREHPGRCVGCFGPWIRSTPPTFHSPRFQLDRKKRPSLKYSHARPLPSPTRAKRKGSRPLSSKLCTGGGKISAASAQAGRELYFLVARTIGEGMNRQGADAMGRSDAGSQGKGGQKRRGVGAVRRGETKGRRKWVWCFARCYVLRKEAVN